MNIGARTLKTGLAVALSVYLCMLLQIEPPLFAATSAIISMQQSLGKGLRNALDQNIVNVAAIAIGIVLGLLIPEQFISMALATILVILFCTKVFEAKNQIVLAVVSAIFIIASPQEQFLNHALMRSLAILIGIGTAIIINFSIAPPKYQDTLVKKLIKLNNMAVQGFADSVNRYLYLNIPQPEELERGNQAFYDLFEETEEVLELYQDDWKIAFFSKDKAKMTKGEFYKAYMSYNRGLWQRAQDILYLAEERRVRRETANNPQVTPLYNGIFEMLFNVVFAATTVNTELQKRVKGEEPADYPEPKVWSRLGQIMTEWQDSNSNTTFYLRSMNEVSVITYNVRWFAKESFRLLHS